MGLIDSVSEVHTEYVFLFGSFLLMREIKVRTVLKNEINKECENI